MNKIVILILVALLVGCDENSSLTPRNKVEKLFPDGEISYVPDQSESETYLVRQPNGDVYYVNHLHGISRVVTNLMFRGKTILEK